MLLSDKSRLQEIYDLRVLAYENSPKSEYINIGLFPKGWFDDLDELDTTTHWIIEDNNRIIASARLAIVNSVKETKEEFDIFELPHERPFVFWSRLVVHPDYRHLKLARSLDLARKSYFLDILNLKFAIGCFTNDRTDSLLQIGFNNLGIFRCNWGLSQSVLILKRN